MTDFTVRPIIEGEQRALLNVLVRSLHGTPPDDEAWARDWASHSAERRFGAFDGDTPIGTTGSLTTELAVPGGKLLPAAAVDGVGVRADHTRKGVLTRLMAEQLRDCARRGDLVAMLHASEATIYGRFGYGTATSAKTLVVDRAKARIRPELPKTGTIRLLDDEQAMTQIPELYRRIGAHRPGMIARPEGWWRRNHDRGIRRGGLTVAVHRDQDGDDGFVVYRTTYLGSFDDPERGVALEVQDLHGTSPAAVTGLWRYLISVDLVGEIRAPGRPADEPVDAMLTNPRACQVRAFDD
ncbi:MAG: GNAT family N-acetyltransferase, partial [Sciscionella sp.]